MRLPGRDLTWKQFIRELVAAWQKDNLGDVAGALTFFGVLAIFPFLIFLVSLAALLIDPELARSLTDELATVAPPEVTTILGDQLQSLVLGGSAGLTTIAGLGAIWAASGGVMALTRSLNRAYGVRESRPFWKLRGIAILGTVIGAGMILVAGAIAVATPAITSAIGGPAPALASLLRLPVAGLLMMLVWALAYWGLPDGGRRFQFFTPGSLVGVPIWLVASWGFSVYVRNFGNYGATYGALTSVIVLLVWMWIGAQVILLGAEINVILGRRSPDGGRERVPPDS